MRASKSKFKRGDMVLYQYKNSYGELGVFILCIDGSINHYYKLRLMKEIKGKWDRFVSRQTPRDHIENYSRKLAQDLNSEMVGAIYG